MSEQINEVAFTVLGMFFLVLAIAGFLFSTMGLAITIYFILTLIGGAI